MMTFLCNNTILAKKNDSVQPTDRINNVIWNSPSENASGSMPLGNGDIGLNAWVEPSGDLLFYIGKTDAFDENSILQKIGRIRVHFNPQPNYDKNLFQQELVLNSGEILIKYGSDLTVRLWVDANSPVINIESKGKKSFQQTVSLETWRNSISEYADTQVSDMFKSLTPPDPFKTYIYPDTVKSAQNTIRWFHANCLPKVDGYMENLKIQRLDSYASNFEHPLFQRVSGALIQGNGLKTLSEKQLISEKPSINQLVQIYVLNMHPASSKQWCDSVGKIAQKYQTISLPKRKIAHDLWWKNFWERSKIDISTTNPTEKTEVYELSRAYNLSRFMNACGGRGALPIKYNGSIFTYGKPENPDYRRWGGVGYWFQNQRHTYYPMTAQGDFDLMQPFFNQYHDILPWQKIRTKLFFNHEGAFFPETITFWGTEVSSHYGWEPMEKRKNPLASCTYLTYYWQNGIEILGMMLNYLEYTNDTTFLNDILLPHAEEITLFYDKHYQLDNSGKILFAPAQSLETYHVAINPLPEIAGLDYVLPKILNIPSKFLPEKLKNRSVALLKNMPPIPIQQINGKKQLVPAESWSMRKNVENPELYAIFPYRLYGDKKKDYEYALNAYQNRVFKKDYCWQQDVIDAVLLGLKDDAKSMIIARAASKNYSKSRFPAFWDEGYDWIPDIDHGGVLQNALNLMLLQCEGNEIRILPCWPKDWNVDFKLHAPQQTVVEASVRDGKIVFLNVKPQSRLKDVIFNSSFATTITH